MPCNETGVVALEPSLAPAKSKLAGGIYCPTDETGESAKFARALAAKIVTRGGSVQTGMTIAGLDVVGGAPQFIRFRESAEGGQVQRLDPLGRRQPRQFHYSG